AARRDPQLMGDAMRTAFEDWLAAEAARRPVVLAIEDLQWADRPSVQALDAALRHLEEAPLMVIATGRPEVEQTFPGLWADRDRLDVHLARLTKRSAAKLVRAALPEADEALVAQLVARADGNAFFLEELVRAVARDADAALPESILGMVEARLGELDPAARRVLRAASVFGARFWTGGVGHLLGPADAPAAERWLTLFAEDELIGRAATSAFPAETEWRFRQALLRDAAHATLTDEDRRLGHRLAAEWLEEAGEQDAATLAEHLDRAGEGARAAARYAQAADRALEAGDFERVLDLAKRALEGSELSPGLRGRLRLHQAEAHRWRAEYAQAADRALAALEHLPPGSEAWFQAVGNVVVASGVRGDAETAKRWSERALGTPAATEEAARARLVALCRAAHQQLGAGDLAAADRTIGAAAKTAGTLEAADPWTDAWLATTRAARSLHAGEIGPYLEGTAAAIRAYDAAGDVRHACNQRVRLGYGYVEVGDLPRAEEELRAALQQAERLGVPLVAGYALQNLGWVRALRGDAKEGRALEERALALGQRLGNPGLEGGARFYLGQIARAAGDAAAAVAQGEAALHAVESIPPLRTLCLAALARALRLAGRGEEALARAREASDARGTLASMEEGEALVWLAYLEALDAGAPPEERARAEGQARAALERRLAKLPAEHRRSYLAVPDHAALARAVGLA
ncbi:MAG TPA: serine/threonine-protein kinase PknK, partial [Polyangiaceae bacterium LLY-WYZ-15_(1-7)]|nr:serine/threonine-protein kinase PknK [Polyangiaceae bacterium LLY-WYZ-15_(1-7)]